MLLVVVDACAVVEVVEDVVVVAGFFSDGTHSSRRWISVTSSSAELVRDRVRGLREAPILRLVAREVIGMARRRRILVVLVGRRAQEDRLDQRQGHGSN